MPAAGAGGASGLPPAAPRTPGVYTGLECRVQDYHCARVGCGTELEEGGANVVCSGCRSVVYCDVECQGAHWEAHMDDCFVAVRKRLKSGDVHKDDEGGEFVLRNQLRVCEEKYGKTADFTLGCRSTLDELLMSQGRLAEAGDQFRVGCAWRAGAPNLGTSTSPTTLRCCVRWAIWQGQCR